MSTQKINQQSIQITTTGAKTLLATTTKEGDSPDITKLVIANSSASSCLVTISDGVSNYYYAVLAGGTVTDDCRPIAVAQAGRPSVPLPSAAFTFQQYSTS